MARTADFSALSRDDLLLAVRDLVARGRVTAAEVREAPARARRIAVLEAELAQLRGNGSPRRGPGRPAGALSKAKPKAGRNFTVTAAVKAARVMQGRYLGRLRKLSPKDRVRVKAVAKANGVPAAVKAADKILAS